VFDDWHCYRGKEVFAELSSLQISPCEAKVLEAHKMVHEIVFAWPKEILFVNFVDYVMLLSCVPFCWFEWRGMGDSTGKSAKGFLMILRTILNLSGKSASSSCILRATGLYFFFAANVDSCSEPPEGFRQSSDMFVVGVVTGDND
jgi:hypothetical protein